MDAAPTMVRSRIASSSLTVQMNTSTSGSGSRASSQGRLRSTSGVRLLSRVRPIRPIVVPIIASVSMHAKITPTIQSMFSPSAAAWKASATTM